MATPKIRLSDEKHERLRQLAEQRNICIRKLIEELLTVALTEVDAETRFQARAALGSQSSFTTAASRPYPPGPAPIAVSAIICRFECAWRPNASAKRALNPRCHLE